MSQPTPLRWKPVDPGSPTIYCAMCGKDKPRADFYATRIRQGCRDCRLTPENRARIRKQSERIESIFSHGKSKAKLFGFKWEIAFDQFKVLKAQPCHYCEGPLEPTGTSLDRLDPKGDYVLDNVVPCCGLCNTTRARTYTPDQMRRIGTVIKEIRAECAANGEPVPIPEPYRVRQEKIAARRRAKETA